MPKTKSIGQNNESVIVQIIKSPYAVARTKGDLMKLVYGDKGNVDSAIPQSAATKLREEFGLDTLPMVMNYRNEKFGQLENVYEKLMIKILEEVHNNPEEVYSQLKEYFNDASTD